uniref:Uncharacterized protein n=1 Tax=Candidatus Kentrum sp. FW TaxID=2126338 RepID=A0A450S0T0_9GAMM|nr:MAG: hypothetical protein BECKFW1821A_GA0114235_100919 [Candidatus Kentron sp. FW]
MAGEYERFVSDAVLDELDDGDYPNKAEIRALVSGIPSLPAFDDLGRIVKFYVSNYVMPNSLAGDAMHLAYASYHHMEYLPAWNCNHLANANKRRHIQVINARLGLATPEIITPLELFKEEKRL